MANLPVNPPHEAMDYMTDDILNAYSSARLRYIRADPQDEHFKAFIPRLEQDPVIQALASSAMMKPKSTRQFDAYAQGVASSLLGVAICLSPELEQQQEARDGEQQSEKNKNDNKEKEEKKPTIIGVMCLGWGGVPIHARHHRSAPIGISLAKDYQNRGFGREAINWMLDWAFRHAGLHSVSICAASYNPRGVHLYQDIGFVLEGRRRETIWFNRGWHDELEFGMTEREWEALRGLKPL